jgi:hypothetical protein
VNFLFKIFTCNLRGAQPTIDPNILEDQLLPLLQLVGYLNLHHLQFASRFHYSLRGAQPAVDPSFTEDQLMLLLHFVDYFNIHHLQFHAKNFILL